MIELGRGPRRVAVGCVASRPQHRRACPRGCQKSSQCLKVGTPFHSVQLCETKNKLRAWFGAEVKICMCDIFMRKLNTTLLDKQMKNTSIDGWENSTKQRQINWRRRRSHAHSERTQKGTQFPDLANTALTTEKFETSTTKHKQSRRKWSVSKIIFTKNKVLKAVHVVWIVTSGASVCLGADVAFPHRLYIVDFGGALQGMEKYKNVKKLIE